MLTSEQIQQFKDDGVLVIENILTAEEVFKARNGFHQQLTQIGINHDQILNGELPPPEGHRIKSPVSQLFYGKWKMDVTLHPKVAQAMQEIMDATYASGKEPGFEHPMGSSDYVVPMIDRVCWRLPDHIRAEGGLDLHLDRDPVDPYLISTKKGLYRWRPIQSFVALTDHYGGESGGLRIIKGFHKRIDDFFDDNKTKPSGGGEFFRMGGTRFTNLIKECQPIDVPAGSLVLWDNRLVHATCQKLTSSDTREVVYLAYLPAIDLNVNYLKDQLKAIKANKPPPAYANEELLGGKDWSDKDLTDNQKKLLGF